MQLQRCGAKAMSFTMLANNMTETQRTSTNKILEHYLVLN